MTNEFRMGDNDMYEFQLEGLSDSVNEYIIWSKRHKENLDRLANDIEPKLIELDKQEEHVTDEITVLINNYNEEAKVLYDFQSHIVFESQIAIEMLRRWGRNMENIKWFQQQTHTAVSNLCALRLDLETSYRWGVEEYADGSVDFIKYNI